MGEAEQRQDDHNLRDGRHRAAYWGEIFFQSGNCSGWRELVAESHDPEIGKFCLLYSSVRHCFLRRFGCTSA